MAANTGQTLCQSFRTRFVTITWITWSKSRKIISRFSVNFWSFRNFLKTELTFKNSDFNFCDQLNELFHMIKNIKFSKVFSKSKNKWDFIKFIKFYKILSKKTGIPAGIPVFRSQSRSQSRVKKSIPGPGSRWDPGPSADPCL